MFDFYIIRVINRAFLAWTYRCFYLCAQLHVLLFSFSSLTRLDLLQVNKLIGDLPEVVHYYLRHLVFPDTMKFQRLKISACGHELGSDILFGRRVGFSGTPSNLMPSDLGECKYEDGSDLKHENHDLSTLKLACLMNIRIKVNPAHFFRLARRVPSDTNRAIATCISASADGLGSSSFNERRGSSARLSRCTRARRLSTALLHSPLPPPHWLTPKL